MLYTIDMFYMAANISRLVDVNWFVGAYPTLRGTPVVRLLSDVLLGLPFNDTTVFHLEMAQHGQHILGDKLLGIQAGNEPDLYQRHEKRPAPYGPGDYIHELERLIQTVDPDPNIPVKNRFIAPSTVGEWTLESIWDAGFFNVMRNRLYALTVERCVEEYQKRSLLTDGFCGIGTRRTTVLPNSASVLSLILRQRSPISSTTRHSSSISSLPTSPRPSWPNRRVFHSSCSKPTRPLAEVSLVSLRAMVPRFGSSIMASGWLTATSRMP